LTSNSLSTVRLTFEPPELEGEAATSQLPPKVGSRAGIPGKHFTVHNLEAWDNFEGGGVKRSKWITLL
jgi:hypothetical protein